MPCKGKCHTYAVDKQSHFHGYAERTRCRTCAVYLPKGLIICPCCNSKLKTQPAKRYR